MYILLIKPTHLLGQPRYEVDCTFLAAHGRFMFLTEPAFPTSAVQGCTNAAIAGSKGAAMWVTFVAYMDVGQGREQGAEALQLLGIE